MPDLPRLRPLDLSPPSGTGQGLDDRASWSYLDTCHTASEQRNQPLTVAAAEDTGMLTHHLDDLVDESDLVVVIGILICQVRVVASKEPDPQHDSCHGGNVARTKPGERLAGAVCAM